LDTDAMGEDGAAVLEVVEASGNAGDVEGAVGVEGAVALGGCEPVEVGVSSGDHARLVLSGMRGSGRSCSGATGSAGRAPRQAAPGARRQESPEDRV